MRNSSYRDVRADMADMFHLPVDAPSRNVNAPLTPAMASQLIPECGYRAGYEPIFAEDAMTSVSAEAHDFAVRHIFPRMGRVRTVADVLRTLAQ